MNKERKKKWHKFLRKEMDSDDLYLLEDCDQWNLDEKEKFIERYREMKEEKRLVEWMEELHNMYAEFQPDN